MKLIAAFCLSCLIITEVVAQPGSPDPSFGNNGHRVLTFSENGNAIGCDIVSMTNGSMYLCGSSTIRGGFVVRLNSSGEIDNTFGSNGFASLSAFNADTISNISLQADGKIVVSGITGSLSSYDRYIYLARFNINGSLDATFSNDGFYSVPLTGLENGCNHFIQPDGKIVVVGGSPLSGGDTGALFVRVMPTGNPDNTFGINGIKIVNISGIGFLTDAVYLPDGKIIGLGRRYSMGQDHPILVKINSNGSTDNTFGSNGVLFLNSISDFASFSSIVRCNSNLYLSGGAGSENSSKNILVCKLDLLGNLVNSFGTNGLSIISTNSENGVNEEATDIVIQPNLKIDISGFIGNYGGNEEMFVMRLFENGTPDPGFGITGPGYTKTDFGVGSDRYYALDLQDDGKIIATGRTSSATQVIGRYLNDGFAPELTYNVSADSICVNGVIHYSCSATGANVQFYWEFEGGNPSTSANSSVYVNYPTTGTFDVHISATNAAGSDVADLTDFIDVGDQMPEQPSVPDGSVEVCPGRTYTYSVIPASGAMSYQWYVDPDEAGSFDGQTEQVNFSVSDDYEGNFTITAQSQGICGYSASSAGLTSAIVQPPLMFFLTGGGTYCPGDPPIEIILSGSEPGVQYELFRSGSSTGDIKTGTGEMLIWEVTDEGFYLVTATNAYCDEVMDGDAAVVNSYLPGESGIPQGNTEVCNNEISYYSIAIVPYAETYLWSLTPVEAGILTNQNDTVLIAWNAEFSGNANLSVVAQNVCGNGPESPSLSISIANSPHPVITGVQFVCFENQYSYTVLTKDNDIYTWNVTGGVITEGNGTSSINVYWNVLGEALIELTQTNTLNCTTIAEPFDVEVNICENSADLHKTLQLKVVPNPASNSAQITIPGEGKNKSEIQIINNLGIMVERVDVINVQSIDINLRNQTPGFYTVILVTEGKIIAISKLVLL